MSQQAERGEEERDDEHGACADDESDDGEAASTEHAEKRQRHGTGGAVVRADGVGVSRQQQRPVNHLHTHTGTKIVMVAHTQLLSVGFRS